MFGVCDIISIFCAMRNCEDMQSTNSNVYLDAKLLCWKDLKQILFLSFTGPVLSNHKLHQMASAPCGSEMLSYSSQKGQRENVHYKSVHMYTSDTCTCLPN